MVKVSYFIGSEISLTSCIYSQCVLVGGKSEIFIKTKVAVGKVTVYNCVHFIMTFHY